MYVTLSSITNTSIAKDIFNGFVQVLLNNVSIYSRQKSVTFMCC